MARISGEMWDELAGQLLKADKKVPGLISQATEDVAKIYEEETKKEIRRIPLYDSGALALSIKRGPIMAIARGRRVEVWPQGNRRDKKHPKGERNETIGFVLIHGRPGKYKGRDYLTAADEKAGPRAVEAIADRIQEVFEK